MNKRKHTAQSAQLWNSDALAPYRRKRTRKDAEREAATNLLIGMVCGFSLGAYVFFIVMLN